MARWSLRRRRRGRGRIRQDVLPIGLSQTTRLPQTGHPRGHCRYGLRQRQGRRQRLADAVKVSPCRVEFLGQPRTIALRAGLVRFTQLVRRVAPQRGAVVERGHLLLQLLQEVEQLLPILDRRRLSRVGPMMTSRPATLP